MTVCTGDSAGQNGFRGEEACFPVSKSTNRKRSAHPEKPMHVLQEEPWLEIRAWLDSVNFVAKTVAFRYQRIEKCWHSAFTET